MSKSIFWIANTCMFLLTILFVSTTGMGKCQPQDPSTEYYLQLYIVLTLIVIPLSLYFSKKCIRKAKEQERKNFKKIYFREKFLISSITSFCIYMHVAIFYAAENNSSLYCALIFMLFSIYVYPTENGAQKALEEEDV